MFHGNKKKDDKDKKPLTEEEVAKIEQTLHKIKTIQKEILDRHNKGDLDEKNLEFLLKAATIMPDFYSLWNYRKRIILEMKKNKPIDDFYGFIKNEIIQISLIQKGNPKSYVLWYHRIWMLKLACEIEKEKSTALEDSMLSQEIKNVNFFLEKDDRNFHVWNHRSTIFQMIRDTFPANFPDFLNKEMEFTITMIKKNCSNFSAWHYRTKLIPLYFSLSNRDWNSPDTIEYFKLDLELITNAVYTDPKDQSAWNYHLWLINNLTPIHVQFSEVDNDERNVKIKFSDIFKCKEVMEVYDVTNETEVKLDISSIITAENENIYSDSIIVKQPVGDEIEGENVRKFRIIAANIYSNLEKKYCFSRNNLHLPEIIITFSSDEIKVEVIPNNFTPHNEEFLNNQLKMIEELINTSDSGFLEYAQNRKAHIQSILYYNRSIKHKEPIIGQYALLKKNSKRMGTMYEEMMRLVI